MLFNWKYQTYLINLILYFFIISTHIIVPMGEKKEKKLKELKLELQIHILQLEDMMKINGGTSTHNKVKGCGGIVPQ